MASLSRKKPGEMLYHSLRFAATVIAPGGLLAGSRPRLVMLNYRKVTCEKPTNALSLRSYGRDLKPDQGFTIIQLR